MLIVFYSLMRQYAHTKTIGIGMFGTTGWLRFEANDEIKKWATAAQKFASGAAQNPALKEKWLQCEGTWYVGVDVLPSDEDGCFDGFAHCVVRTFRRKNHLGSTRTKDAMEVIGSSGV